MFLRYVKSSEDIYIYMCVCVDIYIYIYTYTYRGRRSQGSYTYCMLPATCAYRRSSPTFPNHQPFICRLVLQLLASSHALGRDHPTAWEVSAKTTAHFGLPSPACFKLDSGPTVDSLVQTKAAHIKICAASIAVTAPHCKQTQKSANTNKHKIGPPETLIYQRLVITFNIIQPSTKRES